MSTKNHYHYCLGLSFSFFKFLCIILSFWKLERSNELLFRLSSHSVCRHSIGFFFVFKCISILVFVLHEGVHIVAHSQKEGKRAENFIIESNYADIAYFICNNYCVRRIWKKAKRRQKREDPSRWIIPSVRYNLSPCASFARNRPLDVNIYILYEKAKNFANLNYRP